MKGRRRARELALRALYALEMSGNPLDFTIEDMILARPDPVTVKQFAEDLVRETHGHLSELDGLIKKKSINWEFDRIAVLDRVVLRLAICEFLFFEDIPPKVSIDEAIEIAKKYSTEKSSKFINGILDAIFGDLRDTEKMHKSGRGSKDLSPPEHSDSD